MPFVSSNREFRPAKVRGYRSRQTLYIVAVILGVVVFGAGYIFGHGGPQLPFLESIQIVNRDEAKPSEVDFSLFWDVYNLLSEKYLNRPLDNQRVLYGAIKGMVQSLGDPYTAFMDPAETAEFAQEIEGTFEGVGIEIGIKNDLLTVVAPLVGGPGEAAGLKSGDVILQIDDTTTENMTLLQAVNLIRGPAGTDVKLLIKPVGSQEIKEKTITRSKIEIDSVSYEMEEGNIGHVNINRFDDKTIEQFSQAVDFIMNKNAQGVILDLRNNPGGFLEVAVDLAGYFIKEGVVVTEDFEGDNDRIYRANNNARLANMPTIVLINEGTASAAEIVAGALQDHKIATVIGEKSYGKGSVQEIQELINGSSLRITVADWLTPNGRKIDKEGLMPDIVVQNTEADFNAGRDRQTERALQLLE